MNYRCIIFLAWIIGGTLGPAAVYNFKVVTDASPDYSDMAGLIHSATGNWETPEEKVWAMFYWNHTARRQTTPMQLHGKALTDPIRQFNDYGYTMCSTISGINCAIWDAMGFPTRYWDISNHTVSEVYYDGRWHMYDNSMSAIYTLCDGRTIAGVEDIGKEGACDASDGRSEPGHIARYHCLTATSPRGFLTGADTIRSLDEEYRCFNPSGLKYRSYFYDWDRGHRYILNLRAHETYTRHYRSLGDEPEYFVPNRGRDPEAANRRYRIRGNGARVYQPNLADAFLRASAYSLTNVISLESGVAAIRPAELGELIFKVEGANVITRVRVQAKFLRRHSADINRISISTNHGLSWKEIWQNSGTGETPVELNLIEEVNGAYDALVKVSLLGSAQAADAQLQFIEFETITMVNSKTQPKLLLGRNTIHAGAGAQTESIVLWPELQAGKYKEFIVEEKNMTSAPEHPGYQGVLHAIQANEEAWVVFQIEAPRDITGVEYGGRLYNRAPDSRIAFLHSFDGGRTWTESYSLTDTAQPWDVIHYETVESVPAGARSVLFKYLLNSSAAGTSACGIYSVRMEVNHQPADSGFKPVEITFNWSERQPDYSLMERSHTESVSKLPHRYTINVGGADHPVVNWVRVSSIERGPDVRPGYSDGIDPGGEKFVPRRVTYGNNFALNRPYTVSVPSTDRWEAGDPEGTKLTDGVAGPPYAGGTSSRSALGWDKGQNPEITVDLGAVRECGAFRIQLGAGWPWWDAMKGEVQDRVEVLTSIDGENFQSRGFFDLNLRWKDIPANHFWPDEERIAAHFYELIPSEPAGARLVRFKITPERSLTVSEVEVLDFIRHEPFDLRVALPAR